MSSRLVRLLLALLALGATALAIFLFVFMRPLPVEVARPASQVPIEVFGLGTVEARILSEIGFEVGAALVELNADHGDRVRQGDILARLHGAEQEARVARARAGVVNAEAAVQRMDAAVGRAEAVLAQRAQTNRRRRELVARQAISIETAEEAEMEEAVARAELAVASSDVDVAEAALDDARAQLQMEQVLLEHHVLKAPYDAIVVARHRELGYVLDPGEPLFTLVAPETVWTLAYVDEARAGGLRVGQPALVHLRSRPHEMLQGHVTRIDIESDRVSEERRVYVACDQCPESFHLGEQAEVFITTTVLESALLVPEIAVEHFDGTRGTVWTVEDGVLHRRAVTFGERTLDSRLAVSDGLPAGAEVVSTLRPGLREGRRARVTEAGAP
ncbi:MAG: efflux RND transporter periplasmic adaptor subunit [Geminicoccaceae bacterium]|nr:efflux RND transporter periplasmic adaptor subunit [Geminicoccaceae bacterium]